MARHRRADAAPQRTRGRRVVIGFYENGAIPYNSAGLLSVATSQVVTCTRKNLLPTYGVFDEERFRRARPRDARVRHPVGTRGDFVCEDTLAQHAGNVAALEDARHLPLFAAPASGYGAR